MTKSIRYIHNNPARRGLVETAEAWHYSSAADREGLRRGPIAIDFDTFPRA